MGRFAFSIGRRCQISAPVRVLEPTPCRPPAPSSRGGGRGRLRDVAPALLLGSGFLILLPSTVFADDSTEELKQLRASLQKEIAALKKQEQKLHQEFLKLDRKSELLDQQLRNLRATGVATENAPLPAGAGSPGVALGTGNGTVNAVPPAGGGGSAVKPGPSTEIAQTSQPAAANGAGEGAPAGSSPSSGKSAPIEGPSAQQQQTKQVIETAPQLAAAGGVLTPKGQIVIDPSFEYDYWSQNQLGVNGFQIIPGITFGNIFVNRVEQNISTAAATLRYGITDSWEVNAKLPYVYNTGSTATLIPTGPNAQLLTVSANGSGIGDVQLGTSYQINSGENGWPIFVGNFLLKTATGTSPFDVPILTQDQQPAGPFLAGTPTKLATGTGFYALEPSLTVLMPTAPGVLFANLLFIHNIGRTQNIQSAQGGPATPVKLQPGEAPAITFGIGFSLNDRAAMTFSYQQEHVFTAFANGQAIRGSPYSFGNFNFGLGYQLSQSTRVNLSVGIGVGPNSPVAKILLEVPYKFSL